MNEEITNISEQIKLGAYKLKEIALIEGIHYQTVLERKKRGVYVAVAIRSGKSGKENGKEAYRYLTAEASNAFRAIFATLGSEESSKFCPDVPTTDTGQVVTPEASGGLDTF